MNQEEVDTNWYSECCEALPLDPPGEVDDHCTAFCSHCKDGCGFHRIIAAFPGYPTNHGGVDLMLMQKSEGFFVAEEGMDDDGNNVDSYLDPMPFEKFVEEWKDKETIAKMREAILAANK